MRTRRTDDGDTPEDGDTASDWRDDEQGNDGDGAGNGVGTGAGGGGGGGVAWPVRLSGVTESVVTTLGPNDRWNCAALGLLADGPNGDAPVTARTWGRTRTWRNFSERGEGYVQFVRDPVVFVESALSILEVDDPVLPAANAWARVGVERIASGESGETRWVEWALRPRETAVVETTVPTIDRGHGAVIEATVAASRLDVDTYDTAELLDRLAYLDGVVETCGGPREREAFARLTALTGWTALSNGDADPDTDG